MIDIKKCFIAVTCAVLSAPAFSAATKPGASGCSCQSAIDAAVRGTPTEKETEDNKKKLIPGSDSVVSSLNKIFVLTPKKDVDSPGQSIMDDKIDLYMKNFYTWYGKKATQDITATANLFGKEATIKDKKTITEDKKKEEVLENLKQIDDGVEQEVDGHIRTTLGQTPDDIFKATDATSKLFTTIPKKKLTDAEEKAKKEAMVQNEVEKKAQALKLSALNPLPLLKQGNEKEDIDKLIATFKNTLPPLKVFYLPPLDSKLEESVEIITPIAEKGEYNTIKVARDVYTGEAYKGYFIDSEKIPGVKEKIEKNPLYQAYVLKNVSDLMIRDSLLNNIFYVLKSRERKTIKGEGKQQPSLAEKERQMALEGLDPEYYKALTVAELNLKTLHTNNKMLYFMYKISQQIESANFIQSIQGLQDQRSSSLQDDVNINEIVNIIKTARDAK